jgi:hypothetical protein
MLQPVEQGIAAVLSVSPGSGKQISVSSITSYLNIYRGMYLQSFIFIGELLCDLWLLIWVF